MLNILLSLFSNFSYILLFVVSCAGYGWLFLRSIRYRYDNLVETIIVVSTVGMGEIMIIMLAIGALRLYYPVIGWSIVLFGWILCVVWILRDRPKRLSLRKNLQDWKVDWFSISLFILLVVNLAFPIFSNALVPPTNYDELAYHLAVPKLYVEAQRIINVPFIVYANWPFGTEMLNTLSLLWASESVSRFINWLTSILLCLTIYSFGKRWFDRRTGLIAAAIIATTPMALALVGTNLVEIPLSLYTILAAFFMLDWLESEDQYKFYLSAFFSGIAAGIKLNAALVGVILGWVLVIGLIIKRRTNFRSILSRFALFGLITFTFVAPWYLKTWYQTGNPFWPFLMKIFGGRNWDAKGLTYLLTYIRITNLEPNFLNWLLGLLHLTFSPQKFGGYILGFSYILTIPLSIFVIIRSKTSKNPLIVLLLGVLALLFFTSWFIQTHQTRFLMPALGVFALAASVGVCWLIDILPNPWRITALLAVLFYFLGFSWPMNPEKWNLLRSNYPYISGQSSREEFYTNRIAGYPVFSYANKNLPTDAHVLLTVWEARGYLLEREYTWANPLSQRAIVLEDFKNPDQLNRRLRSLGITHIIITKSNLFKFPFPQNQYVADLVISLLEKKGELLFASGPIELHQLKP